MGDERTPSATTLGVFQMSGPTWPPRTSGETRHFQNRWPRVLPEATIPNLPCPTPPRHCAHSEPREPLASRTRASTLLTILPEDISHIAMRNRRVVVRSSAISGMKDGEKGGVEGGERQGIGSPPLRLYRALTSVSPLGIRGRPTIATLLHIQIMHNLTVQALAHPHSMRTHMNPGRWTMSTRTPRSRAPLERRATHLGTIRTPSAPTTIPTIVRPTIIDSCMKMDGSMTPAPLRKPI